MNSHRPKEVGADWKTAALEFKAIVEKSSRVVEFGQAQNIPAAENFILWVRLA
jgi:hypothetical protein